MSVIKVNCQALLLLSTQLRRFAPEELPLVLCFQQSKKPIPGEENSGIQLSYAGASIFIRSGMGPEQSTYRQKEVGMMCCKSDPLERVTANDQKHPHRDVHLLMSCMNPRHGHVRGVRRAILRRAISMSLSLPMASKCCLRRAISMFERFLVENNLYDEVRHTEAALIMRQAFPYTHANQSHRAQVRKKYSSPPSTTCRLAGLK